MFARTPRLLLRPIWPEDTPALARLASTDPIVRSIVAQRDDPATDLLPDLLIILRRRDTLETIGRIRIERCDNADVALALWIVPERQDQGYAAEAILAMLEMAKHGLRLESLIAIPADRSGIRLLESLGFVQDLPGHRLVTRFQKVSENPDFTLAA